MTSHGKALVLATEKALIVVGMPFGSYEQSPQMAFRRAAWIMKETGSGAIKLEGGLWMADTICRGSMPVSSVFQTSAVLKCCYEIDDLLCRVFCDKSGKCGC